VAIIEIGLHALADLPPARGIEDLVQDLEEGIRPIVQVGQRKISEEACNLGLLPLPIHTQAVLWRRDSRHHGATNDDLVFGSK
jgi:hypothetical protein